MKINKNNNIRLVITAMVLFIGGYYIQQISSHQITSDSKILPSSASADVPAPPGGGGIGRVK